MLLIVENEFTDSGRQARSLPVPFVGPGSGSVVVGWDACADRPDGVRRRAQVMCGDVRHRGRLACRQRGELRWIGHLAGSGVRPEGRLACVAHTYLAADPGAAGIDSLARPAVTWLLILEQMQHVLRAKEGPVSQQSVVVVRESPPATDGDQPRVTLFREDHRLLAALQVELVSLGVYQHHPASW